MFLPLGCPHSCCSPPLSLAHSIQIRHGHKAHLTCKPVLQLACSLSTYRKLHNKNNTGLGFLIAFSPLHPPSKFLSTLNRKCSKEELWTISLDLPVNLSKMVEFWGFLLLFHWNELSRLLWIFICTSSITRVLRLTHLFPATSCNFQCWLLHSKSGQHNLHVLISDSSTYLKILRMNHRYMFAEFLLMPVKEGSHWQTVEQSSRQERLWCLGTLCECALSKQRI